MTSQQKKGLKAQLLHQYGGKDESALPQTLVLDHVSPGINYIIFINI